MKDLLKRGFGTSIIHAGPIRPQDEERMLEKGIFGNKDSETFQQTMLYYNCRLFGLRKHDKHRELECSQFVLETASPENIKLCRIPRSCQQDTQGRFGPDAASK